MTLHVTQLTAQVDDRLGFSDINLCAEPGETVGILGDAQSGKTELIQLLSGLRTPMSGTVHVGPCNVHQNLRQAQQYVSVVPRTLALFPNMNVIENLAFWGQLFDLSSYHLLNKVNTVLEQVGFTGHHDEKIAALDILAQKRVHLAAALLNEPQLLMLDQPTERMTTDERDSFLHVVRQLQDGERIILYATDSVAEIQFLAERVAILDEGAILADGTVDELRRSLGGQSQIVVRCHPLQAFVKVIEKAAIAHTIDEERNESRLWTTKPKELLAQLFSVWQQEGIVTESVRIVEPTLAGVYLHLTGKSLDS